MLSPARQKQLRTPPLLESEYVEVLREERNRTFHKEEAKLSQEEFDSLIENVTTAFYGIGACINGIDKMKTAVLQTRKVKELQWYMEREVARYVPIR